MPPPRPPTGPGGPGWLRDRLPWVVGAVVLALVVAGAGLWWVLRDPSDPEPDRADGSGDSGGGGSSDVLGESMVVVPADLGDGVQLYAVGDGTRETLTEEAVEPNLPSVSPDRRHVYFRSGGTVDEWQMAVLDVATEEVVPGVPEDPPGASCINRPAWDPDAEGEVVVLCRLGEGPQRQVFHGVAGDNGQITGLTPMAGLDQVELGNPTYTGAGGLVVTFGPKHPQPGVHVFPDASPSDPGEDVALTSGEAEDSAGSPVDGRILYRSEGGLRMVADDGTEESLGCPREPQPDPVTQVPVCILVEPSEGVVRDPAWSPDGSRVVFDLATDVEADTGQLLVLELAQGAEPEPFTDQLGEVSGPAAWSSR